MRGQTRAQFAAREPVFNIPLVILALLVAMAAIQLWRGTISDESDAGLLSRYAFVPGRLTYIFDPEGILTRVAAWTTSASKDLLRQASIAQFFLAEPWSPFWTLLTYAFLHGDWTHLGLNGLWLLAFGSPVARRFGNARFLIFMAVAAIAGAVTHWLCFFFDFQPVIGASAAVSGCMGAAVRFMFTLQDAPDREDREPGRAIRLRAAPPLQTALRDRRVISFLLVWMIANAFFGLAAYRFGMTEAPVAWQAHVGGFAVGLLLFRFFDPPRSSDVFEPAPVVESSDIRSGAD